MFRVKIHFRDQETITTEVDSYDEEEALATVKRMLWWEVEELDDTPIKRNV